MQRDDLINILGRQEVWGNIHSFSTPSGARKKWRVTFKKGGPQYFTTTQVVAICHALEAIFPERPAT